MGDSEVNWKLAEQASPEGGAKWSWKLVVYPRGQYWVQYWVHPQHACAGWWGGAYSQQVFLVAQMVRSGGYTRRLWEGPEGPGQTGEMVFRPHEVHQKCKVLHWWRKKPRHWSMLMATQLESSCAEKEPWLSNMNVAHALSFCLRVKKLKVCLI